MNADGAAVITLTGEVDVANARGITMRVDAALTETKPTSIILHMSDVTFLDSTGLGAMISARAACTANDIELIVREPSMAVRKILQITATAQLFGVIAVG